MPLHQLENCLLLDRFRIGRRLRNGSYAEIHEARDLQTQEAVIVKALNPNLRGTADAELERMLQENFRREGEFLARFHHEHVVRLLARGRGVTASGTACECLVLEHLAGGSLYEHCRRNPMSLEDVIRYFGPICNALSQIHAEGLLHRDLKPTNLLFTSGRTRLKLIDFGVAKQFAGPRAREITRVGTEVYSPPEHNPNTAGNAEPLTAAADVYSLAKTIYTALAGRAPHEFRGRPIRALPESLATREWGPPLLHLLQRATAERVAERHRSVDEFWGDLMGLSHSPPNRRATDRAKRARTEPTNLITNRFTETLKTTAQRLRQANRIVIDLLGPSRSPAAPAVPAASTPTHPLLARPVRLAAILVAAWGVTLFLQDALIDQLPLTLANALSILAGGMLATLGILFLRRRSVPGRQSPSLPDAAPSPPSPMENGTMREYPVVRVDATGRIVERRTGQTRVLLERLSENLFLEMAAIPGGTFRMGSSPDEAGHKSAESPQHRVQTPSFHLGRFPITQAQWRAVAQWPPVTCELNASPALFPGDQLPVENISWFEAKEFCERLQRKTGRRYRLPSEAEWEYACRAGTQTPFHFGPTITPQLVNYDGRLPYGAAAPDAARDGTSRESALPYANGFGLFAMHGNVWEWCADPWHEDYRGAPTDGSAWTDGGNDQYRVMRGGAWFNAAGLCRSAYRFAAPPTGRGNNCGFRVALDAD